MTTMGSQNRDMELYGTHSQSWSTIAFVPTDDHFWLGSRESPCLVVDASVDFVVPAKLLRQTSTYGSGARPVW